MVYSLRWPNLQPKFIYTVYLLNMVERMACTSLGSGLGFGVCFSVFGGGRDCLFGRDKNILGGRRFRGDAVGSRFCNLGISFFGDVVGGALEEVSVVLTGFGA